jgi:hypothetical protein
VHPEYDTATSSSDPDALGVYVRQPAWTQVNRRWREVPPADELRAAVAGAAGGGAFAYFSRQAGFGVEQRFDPQGFAALGLFWDPSRQQINLELETPVLALAAGQQAAYAYEVRYLSAPPGSARTTTHRKP